MQKKINSYSKLFKLLLIIFLFELIINNFNILCFLSTKFFKVKDLI